MQTWFYCNKCGCLLEEGKVDCPNCKIDYNKPVPPNVINFDGRSPEARRIADLERRVVELEERSICFDLYLKDAVRRIDALEAVMVAHIKRSMEYGSHITRVDIDIT